MPTTGGEAVSPLVGVVIPSVVVPVVVVIGVLGMGVALLIWCYRQRKNRWVWQCNLITILLFIHQLIALI